MSDNNQQQQQDAMEQHLLKIISEEIERKYDCKVLHINLCSFLGTPNVQVKIQYNNDLVYKPCEHWKPEMIIFSERSVRFFRRIDFFDCVKELANKN